MSEQKDWHQFQKYIKQFCKHRKDDFCKLDADVCDMDDCPLLRFHYIKPKSKIVEVEEDEN